MSRNRRWSAAMALVLLAGLGAGCSSTQQAGAKTKHIAAKQTTSKRRSRATTANKASTSGTTRSTQSTPSVSPSSAPTPYPTWSLVAEPENGLRSIYSLMSSARHTLDMTMYELADPTAIGILEADAARGVEVRVLLDKDYSGYSVNQSAFSQLQSKGVQVRWAYPDTIFHQKTITVDGSASAIMSLNLTSQYYSTDRDFAVITTDRADIAAIQEVFDDDWSGTTAPGPGPTGDNLVWSPGAEPQIVSLINSAQRSLLVENEEMDNSEVIDALASAARRGVDVDVVMTYSPSWADAFEELVAAGVHVSTYSPGASLYIHAKVLVADDQRMILGSQNFSTASLDYNRELGILTADPVLVDPVARTVESDFAGATAFTPPAVTTPATTTPSSPSAEASCQASAAPANDGYSGDYDVSVISNQPDTEATATDATDHWSDKTNASGDVVIRLYHTSPGEPISVSVGPATCSTSG